MEGFISSLGTGTGAGATLAMLYMVYKIVERITNRHSGRNNENSKHLALAFNDPIVMQVISEHKQMISHLVEATIVLKGIHAEIKDHGRDFREFSEKFAVHDQFIKDRLEREK